MSWNSYYPPYVSVAEKKAKAQRQLEKLRKKNKNLSPIILAGRTLAQTWWGKAWNTNLESYADFSNRIERGRNYIRSNMVLDLKIEPGLVKALVQGSVSTPYEIKIKISALSEKKWRDVKVNAQGKLETLNDLLKGKFPKELSELFTNQTTGLFPKPSEIEFNCSCPDYASMCKHVAAALYGVGARLDNEPSLFFTLRKIDMKELIGKAIEDTKTALLEKAKKKSDKVIADADLSSLFGIEMETPTGTKDAVKKKAVVSTEPAKTMEPDKKAKKQTEQKKSELKSEKKIKIKVKKENGIVKTAAKRQTDVRTAAKATSGKIEKAKPVKIIVKPSKVLKTSEATISKKSNSVSALKKMLNTSTGIVKKLIKKRRTTSKKKT